MQWDGLWDTGQSQQRRPQRGRLRRMSARAAGRTRGGA